MNVHPCADQLHSQEEYEPSYVGGFGSQTIYYPVLELYHGYFKCIHTPHSVVQPSMEV